MELLNKPTGDGYLPAQRSTPRGSITADGELSTHDKGVMARKAQAANQIVGLSPAVGQTGKPVNLDLESAYQMVLDDIGQMYPDWADRIRIGRSERDFTARQFAGCMIAYMLEHGLHLSVVPHPLFQPGVDALGESLCPECQQVFRATVPGQKYCTNDCGNKAWRRQYEADKAKRAAEERRRVLRRHMALVAGDDI